MLNQVILMGRLTKDPELRTTGNGVSVVSFSIAVDRDIKGPNGERKTDFIDIVAWRNTAEYISKNFTKGRMVVVKGRLQPRTWQDNDGRNCHRTEVEIDSIYFADYMKKDDAAQSGSLPFPGPGNMPLPEGFVPINDDDDLPF